MPVYLFGISQENITTNTIITKSDDLTELCILPLHEAMSPVRESMLPLTEA